MDGRRVVMVYLEIEIERLPTCAFKESPGAQPKTGEVTCQTPHSPQSYSCEKEGRIVPAKDMKSFTEHFVSKASHPCHYAKHAGTLPWQQAAGRLNQLKACLSRGPSLWGQLPERGGRSVCVEGKLVLCMLMRSPELLSRSPGSKACVFRKYFLLPDMLNFHKTQDPRLA